MKNVDKTEEIVNQLKRAFDRLCLQIEPVQVDAQGEVVEKLYKKTTK